MSDALEIAQETQGAPVDGLLTENPAEVVPNINPFALTEDHEFKALEVERVDVYRVAGNGTATLVGTAKPGQAIVDTTPVPAMPGTPESDYRRCPCTGVMPGRACPRCNCSRWVKQCPKCLGSRVKTVQSRKGAHPRTEPCGFCMGLGQVAARMEEVRAAQELASAYTPPEPQGKPPVLRGAMPGGRTATFAERAAKKAKPAKRKRSARG